MSTETNKAAVHAFFADIDRAQSMKGLASYTSPSYVAHFPGAPVMNLAATQGFGDSFFQACPGLRHVVHEVIAEGERVAARLVIHGTHTQPLVTPMGPIPALSKSFQLEVVNLYRFEEGKIAEHHSVFDMLGFLQQIGAMPGA